MSRARRLSACVAAWLVVGGAAAWAKTVTVSQRDRSFSVASVSIARGDTIHFTNDDEFAHQMYVESPSFSFDSDEKEPGETMDMVFPTAGSFTVQCHIHPRMMLHVEVR